MITVVLTTNRQIKKPQTYEANISFVRLLLFCLHLVSISFAMNSFFVNS